jgi:hypothetical protein
VWLRSRRSVSVPGCNMSVRSASSSWRERDALHVLLAQPGVWAAALVVMEAAVWHGGGAGLRPSRMRHPARFRAALRTSGAQQLVQPV